MRNSTETTILGGLPVTIEFDIGRADWDVGYPGGVENVEITEVAGRKTRNTAWIEKRMKKSDWEKLYEDAEAAAGRMNPPRWANAG